MSVPCDRIRGLGASPEGIPTSTSSFGLEYVLGVPRERGSIPGHVWAHPWTSLTQLLEGGCRTRVEGQPPFP
jgi:hypothetical protein